MRRNQVGSRELLGGLVLPATAPCGGCPDDGDSVGICLQPAAQRAGKKRAVELAPALLTHQLMFESNHHPLFYEHVSWKAGNASCPALPPDRCFLPGYFPSGSCFHFTPFHLATLLSEA